MGLKARVGFGLNIDRRAGTGQVIRRHRILGKNNGLRNRNMTIRKPKWYEAHWRYHPPTESERASAIASLVTFLLRKSAILELTGMWAECQLIRERALDLAEGVADDPRVAKSARLLADLLGKMGNFAPALSLCARALEINQQLGDDPAISLTLNTLGNLNLALGNNRAALKCYRAELKINRKSGDRPAVSRAWGAIGNVSKTEGNIAIARQFYEKALAVSQETGDKRKFARTICNLGNLQADHGDFMAALNAYQQSLAISQELGDVHACAVIDGNIGIIYRDEGDFATAMAYFEKQLKICRELGYTRGIYIAIGNIGMVYTVTGDWSAAVDCFDKAYQGHRGMDFKYGMTYWLGGKAQCFFNQKRFAEAKNVVEECVKLSIALSKPDTLFTGRILLARIDWAMNQREPAIAILDELMTSAMKDSERADVHYQRVQMGLSPEEHRRAALELYQKLYEQTPKYEYRTRIAELSG